MAAPSFTDYFAAGRVEALLRRPDLAILPGDISDMIVAASAAMADALTGYAADRIKATFLDGAIGADLTDLANDHFNVQRVAAIQAFGRVTFSRATAAAGAGSIPAGTKVATVKDVQGNEVQFTTNATAAVGALILTVTADVTCTIGGRGGNVGAAKATRIIDTLFDTTFTVSNTETMTGGTDEETDDELRLRVRAVPSTLRRGTLAALEFGAKTVLGVVNAAAVESATGITTVYVSDVDGNSNAAMVAAVLLELESWRAAGSVVNVSGGILFTLTPITLSLAVRSGVDTVAIAANVKNAIVARLAKLKIGETASRHAIVQAAMNVDIDNILNVTLTAPAADVVPSANQIVRTTVGSITVT